MKDFNPHLVLLQCCPNPLSDDFKAPFNDKIYYRMIMPVALCSWGRDFYFQVILLEFSFQDYWPSHGKKTTFLLQRWNQETRKIISPEGVETDYPILTVYICVNRELFPPQGSLDKFEWLTSIAAPRTEAIAHELLYADQYAKYFDPATGQMLRAIEVPTVDQEEELLCPPHQIQASISHFRNLQENCNVFNSEADFLSQEATEFVQNYYAYWLEKFGVRREICHARTCAYVRMHHQHPVFETALHNCLTKHRIPADGFDALKFKQHVDHDTDFVKEYFLEVEGNGVKYTKSEVVSYTSHILNRKKGSSSNFEI